MLWIAIPLPSVHIPRGESIMSIHQQKKKGDLGSKRMHIDVTHKLAKAQKSKSNGPIDITHWLQLALSHSRRPRSPHNPSWKSERTFQTFVYESWAEIVLADLEEDDWPVISMGMASTALFWEQSDRCVRHHSPTFPSRFHHRSEI